MPRYARKQSGNQIYHVMLRGNNREKVFRDDEDKARVIDILGEKKKDEEYSLYAYCVMDNHIHLIIKEGKGPVSRIVKRLATSYSYYFNNKYKRVGHVFQERFKSECIEDESYLMSAIRYIHQNPIKPGIGSLTGYKWSSYKDYTGKGTKLTDAEEILNMISSSQEEALAEFCRFNSESTEMTFLDIAEEKEIDPRNVSEYITNYLVEKKLEVSDLKDTANKSAKEELIRTLLEKSNLSRRGIAEVLGLNRESVRRICMSRDLSP